MTMRNLDLDALVGAVNQAMHELRINPSEKALRNLEGAARLLAQEADAARRCVRVGAARARMHEDDDFVMPLRAQYRTKEVG